MERLVERGRRFTGHSFPISIALTVAAALLLDSPGPGLVAGESRYAADLKAFFQEMDRTYPFFDLKGIRKEWEATKKQIARKVGTCSSDPEFLGLLLEAMRCLRDGHMGIVQASAEVPRAEPTFYPGISFMPAAGGRVVVMAAPEKIGEALRPGTVVTHIDRKPARKLLEAMAMESWARGGSFSSPQRARLFAYRIPLRGKKGEKHRITVAAGRRTKTVTVTSTFEARGWPHTYNMPEGLTRHGSSCLYGKLPSGVGYMYLRRIDGSTEPGLAAALSAFTDATGWIVDLRGNGGGGYSGELIQRLSRLPPPVATLIDAGCISAGETLARDLARYGKARLFGTTTAGSSSAKRTWSLPSGTATIVVPTRSRWGIDGKPIEFNGIRPHQEVEAVAEEVARGQNSAILRAEKYLLEQHRKGAARK